MPRYQGDTATVAEIFKDNFKRIRKLPVAKPVTQVRRFAHVYDTVKSCVLHVEKINVNITVLQANSLIGLFNMQKLFKSKIRYLLAKKETRFASALTKINLSNRIITFSAKINLKDYVKIFLINNR
jgi:UDP-glucose 4-epimerase